MKRKAHLSNDAGSPRVSAYSGTCTQGDVHTQRNGVPVVTTETGDKLILAIGISDVFRKQGTTQQ